jgi:hypothetical protein
MFLAFLMILLLLLMEFAEEFQLDFLLVGHCILLVYKYFLDFSMSVPIFI